VIATTGDARAADSLLYVYGVEAQHQKACDTASAAFTAVLERKHNNAVTDDARAGLAACALVTGQNLLVQGRPVDAESWFSRATAPEAAPDVSRMAWIGLGDVRLAQGDVGGAFEAYQSAMTGAAPGDSISVLAQNKITALGRATPPPDSHQ
jgi:lipopolysaccharide biosynthesis regulator YciM